MAQNITKLNKKRHTRKTGDLGEQIAVKYLKSRGFSVLETNYLKKWGELDIILEKDGVIHVIEVKTAKFDTKEALMHSIKNTEYRPEELVDDRKLHQIHKATETWIKENRWSGEVQLGVIGVRMTPNEKFATVNYIEYAI